MEPTPEEIKVAQWMLEQYEIANRLVQRSAARQIRQKFGEDFVYKNNNRNWAIKKAILDAFRNLTPEDTVWSRSRQLWRKRKPTDDPDSRMVK